MSGFQKPIFVVVLIDRYWNFFCFIFEVNKVIYFLRFGDSSIVKRDRFPRLGLFNFLGLKLPKMEGVKSDLVSAVIAVEALELDANELVALELDANGAEDLELEANEVEALELEANEVEDLELDALELVAKELDALEVDAIEVEAVEINTLALDAVALAWDPIFDHQFLNQIIA